MTEQEQMELNEVKQFIRVELDDTEEDSLLLTWIVAAKEYITDATGIVFPNTIARADICVKAFVAHWYENREIAGTSSNLDGMLTSMLNQLKYVKQKSEDNVK
ncbi:MULTISPECIES: head-tail connector protein [Bacillus amyloliquefaciens group]|uniref:head-tail connector protein n=1 Tax=Bacillus amyloliquefaciens group TaxID=1938374 RepID=UPI000397D33F|nr:MULTISPECIES: head-tail connector protein [Bacillus amyloliquefaciens group]ERH55274.1 DNA packaging protein [Bacillus amyloliquefaciens EGD-AQ14]